MVAVDTSVLVRFITKDHPALSKQAQEIMSRAKPASLLLDRLVLAELGYVLTSLYGFSKLHITELYKSLLADVTFVIPDREVTAIAVTLFGEHRQLSFEDCWLAALKRAGRVANVHTFDKALQKRL